jgi:hypothetical protein
MGRSDGVVLSSGSADLLCPRDLDAAGFVFSYGTADFTTVGMHQKPAAFQREFRVKCEVRVFDVVPAVRIFRVTSESRFMEVHDGLRF